jgi:hypothetical protein
MTCSWCQRPNATHIGYGVDFDGLTTVLCDG